MSDLLRRIENLSPKKRELLAQHLAATGSRSPSRSNEANSLVTIRSGSKANARWFVHPVGGEVTPYVELAQHLDEEHAFLALRSAGLQPDRAAHSTVESMAEHYVKVMLETGLPGPYILGGWSMGGIVSFEMACRLQMLGREVSCLILIDSAIPTQGTETGILPMSVILQSFANDLWARAGKQRKAVDEYTGLKTTEEMIGHLFRIGVAEGVLGRETDLEHLKRLFSVTQNNYMAMSRYLPKTLYRGNALVIQATESHLAKKDVDYWRRFISGTIAMESIPGDHFTIMRSPGVERLARVVAGRACGRGNAD